MSGKEEDLSPPLEYMYPNTGHQKSTFGVWGASSGEGYEPFYDQDHTVGACLHDEILSIVHNTGLDALASETGILQNGEIPAIKDYRQEGQQKPDDPKPSLKRPAPETPKPAAAPALSVPPASVSAASASNPVPGASPLNTSSRKRRAERKSSADKNGKGLRHFSMKVCSKVEEKKTTTYNEVADDLVAELATSKDGSFDQKNIRRRVYDALNVLMAMGIISKQRKEIRWVGLPYARANRQEITQLELEKAERQERTKRKEEHLKDLLTLHGSYRNLVTRNQKREQMGTLDSDRIQVPFLLVKTQAQAVINCEMAENRTEYYFDFNIPFEIHDDNSVLQAMNLAQSKL